MSDPMQVRTLCKAHKRNGELCTNPPIRGSSVCRMHGGAAPQVKQAAFVRLLMESDPAAARLINMSRDEKLPPAVRLGALREILDRAGLTSKTEVALEIQVQPWEQAVQKVIIVDDLDEVFNLPAEQREVIEDAVVVEDDETERDEQLRKSEQQRVRRMRRRQPPLLPSEEKPASVANEQETPAWYAPTPLRDEGRVTRAELIRRANAEPSPTGRLRRR